MKHSSTSQASTSSTPGGFIHALLSPSASARTGIFLALIGLAVVVLAFSMAKARSENEQYGISMQYYTQAQQALQAGQLDTALELLNQLILSYRDSAWAQFLRGTILVQQGNNAEAATALAQAQEKNARLVENQQFVHTYGVVWLNMQEYAAAQQYFLKSISLNSDPTITASSQELLAQIAAITGGENNE